MVSALRITLEPPVVSSHTFVGTFDLADEKTSISFSRLLVPATASTITACLPTEGKPSTIFRFIEKSDKASIFRSVAISEVLEDGRFKLKAALSVRELRASIALASLALPPKDSKALLSTGSRALYNQGRNKYVACTVSRVGENECDLTEDEPFEECVPFKSLFARAQASPRPGAQVIQRSEDGKYSSELATIMSVDNETCGLAKHGGILTSVSGSRLVTLAQMQEQPFMMRQGVVLSGLDASHELFECLGESGQ